MKTPEAVYDFLSSPPGFALLSVGFGAPWWAALRSLLDFSEPFALLGLAIPLFIFAWKFTPAPAQPRPKIAAAT